MEEPYTVYVYRILDMTPMQGQHYRKNMKWTVKDWVFISYNTTENEDNVKYK